MALNVSSGSKEKVDDIIRSVKDYSVLVGKSDAANRVDGLDCIPGLNMISESDCLKSLSKDLEEGLFKLLVMGKFKNGKSTFINALLSEMKMAANVTATTAVIAVVEAGMNTNTVQIFENGSDTPSRVLSLEDFTKEFSLTEADQKLIENGGDVDRFAKADHVIMQSNDQMFEDGLRLIDSTGLEEAHSRTKTTMQFVPKANAIIFTLSAPSLFSKAERDYINNNFAGRHPRNVFFVVNRIDNLASSEALENNVKPAVRSHLEAVFTDENGRFDEELYNKRVFYTNAFGALCIRTKHEYTVLVGKNAVPVPISIEETGMQEFEAALNEFLNSEERLKATFQSTLSNMANIYQSAGKKIENVKKARSQPIEVLQKNAADAQDLLKELEDQVKAMKKCISNSASNISQKIFNNYLNYVQNDIPREFEVAVENTKFNFGMIDLIKMALAMLGGTVFHRDNSAKLNQIVAPISDEIKVYLNEKLEDWKETIPTLIERDIKDLEEELGESVAQFDLGLERAMDIFANGGDGKAFDGTQKSSVSGVLQTIIALSNWDVSLAVEGMASGGMSWSNFLKRAGLQIGLDFAVTAIMGAPFLIPALIIEVFSLNKRAKETTAQFANKIASKQFQELVDSVRNGENDFKTNVEKGFNESADAICKSANKLIAEKNAEFERILAEVSNEQMDFEAESERQEKVHSAMLNRFNKAYKALYGKEATEAVIAKLAVTE